MDSEGVSNGAFFVSVKHNHIRHIRQCGSSAAVDRAMGR